MRTTASSQNRGTRHRQGAAHGLRHGTGAAAQAQVGSRNRTTELHVTAGIQTERPLGTGTRQIQVTLSVQVQIGGTDHTVARQSQVLRSTYGGSSLRARGQIQHHLLRTGDLNEHISLCRFSHNAVCIDLEQGFSRTNATVRLNVQQTQVHVDPDAAVGRHGQTLSHQAQAVQIQVQVGKAWGLTQNQVVTADRQLAFFADGFRCLQRQGTDTRPAHRIVLSSKQAGQENHGRIGLPSRSAHLQRSGLALCVLLKTDALQELHFLRAVDDQLTTVAQHHFTRELHFACGVDGDVAIHINTLAKGDVHGVADRQPFQV